MKSVSRTRLTRVAAAALLAGLTLSPTFALAEDEPAAQVVVGQTGESGLEAMSLRDDDSTNGLKVTLDKYTFTYDGRPKKPGVTVEFNNKDITDKSGVTVRYFDNTAVTTKEKPAKVYVTYEDAAGTKYHDQDTFTIEELDLSDTDNSGIIEVDDVVYTGEELKPTVTVSVFVGGTRTKLVNKWDYEVDYVNNVAVGTATVVVRGIQNCTGYLIENFEILPDAVVPKRIAGADRYETASQIVSASFPEDDSSSWAVITSGANYADALVASAVAGVRDAPIILTAHDKLSPQAKAQIEHLGVKSLYIVGGTSTVSESVADSLRDMGLTPMRIAGASRTDTSANALKVARDVDKTSDAIVICSGTSFADALSISPWAYATGSPIMLTDASGRLTQAEIDAIRTDGGFSRAIIVGGTSSVSADVEAQLGSSFTFTRLYGADRYDTSATVARWETSSGLTWSAPVVATGKSYPDALAGANLAGTKTSPILLVSSKTDATLTALHEMRANVNTVYILGGEKSVSSDLASYIEEIVA